MRASAQTPDPQADSPSESEDKALSGTMFDEHTGERYREVRPEGLKQGGVPVSVWVPWALGGTTMGLCAFFLVRNARRNRGA